MICGIPGCKHSSKNSKVSEGISFFSLPRDPDTREIWLKAAKRKEYECAVNISICSEHFEEKYKRKCILKTRLVNGAIPSLNLDTKHNNKFGGAYVKVERFSVQNAPIEVHDLPNNVDDGSIQALDYSTETHEIPVRSNDVQMENSDDEDKEDQLDENEKDNDLALKYESKYNIRLDIIDKAIENIMNQLNIITKNDPDSARSNILNSEIMRTLSRYEKILHCDTNYADIYSDATIKEEYLEGDETNDSDYYTRQLREEKNMETESIEDMDEDIDKPKNIGITQKTKTYEAKPASKKFKKNKIIVKCKVRKAARVTKLKKNGKDLKTKETDKSALDPNFTEDGEPIVRHTCPDCDLSLSSAYLLSLHPSICKGRLSKDKNLEYWAKKQCPECKMQFSNNANLKRHLIIHRLREYESKLKEAAESKANSFEGNRENDCDTNLEKHSESTKENIFKTEKKENNFDSKHVFKEKENETILEEVGFNDPVISEILNQTNDGDPINLRFNISGIKYIVPNSSQIISVCDFKCNICDERCSSKDELNEHNKTKHPDGGLPYICNHCPSRFKILFQLRSHVKSHHKEVTMAGGRNKYLAGQKDMTDAYPKNVNFKVYGCSKCTKVFLNTEALNRHERRVHTKDPNLRSYSKKQHEIEKIKIKCIDSKYTCPFCSKSYKSYTGLQMHILDHAKEPLYPCTKCDKKFKAFVYLKRHMNNMHEMTTFCVCEICGAKYSSKTNLKRHLLVHENVKNFICDYCSRGFIFKASLLTHIRIHTREKPWVCRYCSQTFTEKRNWGIHMNEHEGIKPYMCTLCEESFVSKRKLNKHVTATH